jgi:hypothetical protein
MARAGLGPGSWGREALEASVDRDEARRRAQVASPSSSRTLVRCPGGVGRCVGWRLADRPLCAECERRALL